MVSDVTDLGELYLAETAFENGLRFAALGIEYLCRGKQLRCPFHE